MARDGVEVERTYEVPDAPLPDLSAVARVTALPDEDLDATYYDTPDLRLARSRATLRRRTGGRDAGWHLKLPGSGTGRVELTEPDDGDGVPAPLAQRVDARTGGGALQPVVRLRTSRAVLQLDDGHGRVLAEVADDRVSAQVHVPPAGTATWREVEVELVEGDEALLDAVERVLLAWGARPAASPSKLARALGDRVTAAGG